MGQLRGDESTGCLWLEPSALVGETPAPVSLIWPANYAVRTEPLRLVDGSGTVVANVGDMLTIAGASADDDQALDPPCRIGEDTFVVDSIAEVNES
ncbi:MAG: hypothetical protein ACRD29_09755 [Acidimicrobiales bacterium]